MLRLILSLFFLSKLQCENIERELYKDFQIVEIECSEECNVDFTEKFNSRAISDEQFEILHRGKFKYQALVGPEIANDFYSSIENQNSSSSILVPDVSHHISSAVSFRSDLTQLDGGVTFLRYMSMDEIDAYTTKIANDYPEFVKKSVIGESIDAENITMVTISKRSKNVISGNKPIIFIEAGIHAREWVGISTALYMIDQLINNSDLATKFEWRIVPVTNPDGYRFSYTRKRLWRKNMRVNGYTHCLGVDLNRNFGAEWGREGASSLQCSVVYAGKGPFSEPETKAIRNAVLRVKSRIKAYISVHSYSQLILLPPGISGIPVKQETAALLKRTGMKLSRAIQEKTKAKYEYGNSEKILYAAAGTSADWAFLKGGVTHSYTFEMRDRGKFGFLLPEDQIIETGEDLYAAMRELTSIIRSNSSENALTSIPKIAGSIPVKVQNVRKNVTGKFQENSKGNVQRNYTENVLESVHLRDNSALLKNMEPGSSNSNSN